MQKITKITTEYGTSHSFANAIIDVQSMPSGDFAISFKVVSDDLSPRARHDIIMGGKMVCTSLRIRPEAALSLMHGLYDELKRNGILK